MSIVKPTMIRMRRSLFTDKLYVSNQMKKNIYRRFSDWIQRGINIVKQIRQDSIYRKRFIAAIESQCYDPRSAFVKMGLKPSEDGESLIQVVSVPEEVQLNGQDFVIQDKLNESTFFTTKILRESTDLNDYITVPEYFHVEDPSNDNAVSLTYLAVWHFNPMVSDELKKKTYAVLSTVGAVLAGGLGYFAFILI